MMWILYRSHLADSDAGCTGLITFILPSYQIDIQWLTFIPNLCQIPIHQSKSQSSKYSFIICADLTNVLTGRLEMLQAPARAN